MYNLFYLIIIFDNAPVTYFSTRRFKMIGVL